MSAAWREAASQSPTAARIAPRFSAAFGARLAGDQQEQPRPVRDRPLQPLVEQGISGRQIVAVQVERRVGLGQPARQAPIPAAVQRRAGRRLRRPALARRRPGPAWALERPARAGERRRSASSGMTWIGLHALDDAAPERALVSAELAHGRGFAGSRRAAAGYRRGRATACRPRSSPLPRPRPRRCRSGWAL